MEPSSNLSWCENKDSNAGTSNTADIEGPRGGQERKKNKEKNKKMEKE